MKPRLAFIRRAYMPVVERARQMFDVAYEDRQLPADEALRLVKEHKADADLLHLDLQVRRRVHRRAARTM